MILAPFTYSVEPSKTTIDELKGRMRSFLEKVSSVNDFNAENGIVGGIDLELCDLGAVDFGLAVKKFGSTLQASMSTCPSPVPTDPWLWL